MQIDRAVVDSNVLISALLNPSGLPRQTVERLAALSAVLLFSDATFAELARRISHPKFDRYRSAEQMDDWLGWLVQLGEWVHTNEEVIACRDPDDDKFLTIALAGAADVLITGDTDLLVLDPFEGIPIVTPARFLDSDPDR